MTGKWTIKKLNRFDGRPLPMPWHAIPPHTPIPPRDLSPHSMSVLYEDDDVGTGATHGEVMAYVNEQIRGWNMPQIIRTLEELEALDAGTYLVDASGEVMTAVDFIDMGDFPMDDTDMLAVVATEEHIRAAMKALKGS